MLPRIMLRHAVRVAAIAAAAFTLSLHFALAQIGPPQIGPAQTGTQTGPQAGSAQDRRQIQVQGEPGRFDFYVLALSWSPSFCEVSRERYSNRTPDQQCGARPYSFVVHGLWPQYEQGFPSFCQVPAPRLDRAIVGAMLELMPSPRLIFHAWDRHGTCSGLSPQAYFETVRKARAAVKIPAEYLAIANPLTVTPDAVAEAFLKANAGLARAGMAVSCDSKRLSEVRICLAKDFAFRDCAEIARRSCRRDSIVMPPVRGGQAADAR